MVRARFRLGTAAIALGTLLAGCGGSTPDGSGAPGRGPITYAAGKDATGKLQSIVDTWNDRHPDQKVTFVELPESADEQRMSLVQNFHARSARYDVVAADVVWTAEFAARRWLEPLEPERFATDRLLRAPVDTARYDGRLFAAPYTSNAGLLYYRTDLVSTPPATWAELRRVCETVAVRHRIPCYAGQYAPYEGLTVNVLEAINSAGGSVVRNAGRSVTVDSAEARVGLGFLVDGFRLGWIPREAITYKEEESRRAFQQGRLLFLRNWPYVYRLANTDGPDSRIAGRFAVAALPGPRGPGSATLGGYNLALSAFSRRKATAKDWMAFMQSDETQRRILLDLSKAPVVAALYDDPELRRRVPYLGTLKTSLVAAQKRPETPNYNAVTLVIQRQSYEALQGRKSVDQAITDMARELEQAAARR